MLDTDADMRILNPDMNENLQEYVDRIMTEKNLSTFDVARRSDGLISQSHVSRIQNGIVADPKSPKLVGLAKGLGVPEHEMFAVARGLGINKVAAHERLVSIDTVYSSLKKPQRKRADYLIEIIEREIRSMAK
jgi:transcriptional regulator with XRE-family HTH domain